jgi:uncharacterized protein
MGHKEMLKMQTQETPWALVTGASSGLGIELARELAARKNNLILTARREQPMRELASQLTGQYDIEVVVEAADLSQPGSAAALQGRIEARGIEPTILINNAGSGVIGAFLGHSAERMRAMLNLNILSLTELTHIFGARMAARGQGYILLVASIAAEGPTPIMAAYGASKAYVLSLGVALHVELAPAIGVTVLSPGHMDTGFSDAAGFDTPDSAIIRNTKLAPARVAQIGLDAMFAKKPYVIAGRINRITIVFYRFMSRRAIAKLWLKMAKTLGFDKAKVSAARG